MSVMDHPSVLNISDSCKAKGVLMSGDTQVSKSVTYFVMPLAGKGDLSSYLKFPEKHFPEQMASFFFS